MIISEWISFNSNNKNAFCKYRRSNNLLEITTLKVFKKKPKKINPFVKYPQGFDYRGDFEMNFRAKLIITFNEYTKKDEYRVETLFQVIIMGFKSNLDEVN